MNLGPWAPIVGGLMTIAGMFATVEWAGRLVRSITRPSSSDDSL